MKELLVIFAILLNVSGQNQDQKSRPDLRCGDHFPMTLKNGTKVPGECDPCSIHYCCSPRNWCGGSPNHCACARCVNFREIFNRKCGKCGNGNGKGTMPMPTGIMPSKAQDGLMARRRDRAMTTPMEKPTFGPFPLYPTFDPVATKAMVKVTFPGPGPGPIYPVNRTIDKFGNKTLEFIEREATKLVGSKNCLMKVTEVQQFLGQGGEIPNLEIPFRNYWFTGKIDNNKQGILNCDRIARWQCNSTYVFMPKLPKLCNATADPDNPNCFRFGNNGGLLDTCFEQ